MNSFIENLNQWGEIFLSFAWPLLWQSSLLIAILFAFDFLFQRKLRASIRYALWLVVLVKLCLPPTLALPTNPAWWWHQTPPPVVAKPETHFTVTYDNAPLPEMPPAGLPVFVPPKPVMSFAAWLLVISAAVSVALFGWMLVRWWQVAQMVRRAVAAEQFSEQLDEAWRLVGTPASGTARSGGIFQRAVPEAGVPHAGQTSIRLKIVAGQISPAVCGLFRPTILIPQTLAEHFSAEQLRAVLLHELIHLRRRDVWVNFLQALLQIFYWWHPLVWVANARIRRVREEAVDDAVMLALRDEADTYAPTLLEVAKLALNRPLASLGLVGIMESRHALRQRIERLVDFRAPRHAGLTLVSLLEILAFTAVAVPMGEGPAPRTKEIQSSVTAPQNVDTVAIDGSSGRGENKISVSRIVQVAPLANTPQILIETCFYRGTAVEFEQIEKLFNLGRSPEIHESSWRLSADQMFWKQARLDISGFEKFSAPLVMTVNGEAAEVSVNIGTSSLSFTCRPVVSSGMINLKVSGNAIERFTKDAATNRFDVKTAVENGGGLLVRVAGPGGYAVSNLVVLIRAEIVTGKTRVHNSSSTNTLTYTGPERQNILEKLNRIQLESVAYDGLPLSEVLRQLSEKSRLADPEHKGINFMINPNADQSLPAMASMTNGAVIGVTLDPGKFTVKLNLTNVLLTDLLVAITNAAQNPNPGDPRKIQYSIKDYGIVFHPKTAAVPQLFTREFKMDTNFFLAHLRREAGAGDFNSTTNLASAVSKAAYTVITNIGVNMDEPLGKAVFFNIKNGKLLVRATEKDLDVIERLIHDLNTPPIIDPGPQIHIKARFLEVPQRWLNFVKSYAGSSNSNDQVFIGIFTDANFSLVLHQLEATKQFESLGEPEVTTLSGRQTQMRVTQVLELVTNLVYQEDATNGPIIPQIGKVETGPILDVVPYVLPDGYTINLALIPSLTKFLGYNKSINTPTGHNRAGDKFNMPIVSPRFAIRQAVATVNLWDDQTAVICGIPETINVNGSAVAGKPKSSDKELLVFITATLVDQAGNRVHSDRDLPFAQTGVPEQPPQK